MSFLDKIKYMETQDFLTKQSERLNVKTEFKPFDIVTTYKLKYCTIIPIDIFYKKSFKDFLKYKNVVQLTFIESEEGTFFWKEGFYYVRGYEKIRSSLYDENRKNNLKRDFIDWALSKFYNSNYINF